MTKKRWYSLFERPTNKLVSMIGEAGNIIPWGAQKEISREDRKHFGPVLSVWKPKMGKPAYILRWFMTEWCNYACPYCNQTHDRHAPKGSYTAHAFDNHPLEKWIDAFDRHFSEKRLSLVLTGGEPMLDRKNMVPLLTKLTSMPAVECIRIDTNSSWKAHPYKDVDTSRIILMCTYHPSQVTEARFTQRIKEYIEFGFQIGMVNFVMDRGNFGSYEDVKSKFAELGVPLHPNPLWFSQGAYSREELDILKQHLPSADYLYRSQIESPLGKKCLYPALAYEMKQDGTIIVGCHPQVSGSFFDDNLPSLFAGPVPCPAKYCVCLDKYSFLEDVNRNTGTNPLKIYSDMLGAR